MEINHLSVTGVLRTRGVRELEVQILSLTRRPPGLVRWTRLSLPSKGVCSVHQGGGGRRVPGSASQSSPSRAHPLLERRLSALDGSGLVPETERRRMWGQRGRRRTREAAERGQEPSPAVLGGTSACLDSFQKVEENSCAALSCGVPNRSLYEVCSLWECVEGGGRGSPTRDGGPWVGSQWGSQRGRVVTTAPQGT